MEKKAVVLMRLSLLQRSSNEAKIRTKMAREGLIEAVVALPGGIVPHWKEPMALVLLSSGNENILFVDAAVPRFLKRRGRRNGIHRIGEIVETVKGRKETFYSVKVPLQEIEAESLAPSHYLAAGREKEGIPLSELTERIFRAQRVRAPQGLPFGEIGVGDMVREGFTAGPGRLATGNAKRVERFALRPFDILLPLRGNANRVAIVGEHETPLVPNAGVIVLRPRSREDAFGLYLHLLSEKGREELEALYGDCPGRTLNPEALAHWRVKLPDGVEAEKRVAHIFRLRRETERLEKRIEQLLREVPQPGPPPIS
jgi:type I restriction enzyme M protein